MELFLQQIFNGLVMGSTYAIVSVGFALAFTVLRIINFAHPEVFMIGMFAGLVAGNYFPGGGLLVAMLMGAVVAGLIGVIAEKTIIRPLHGKDILMTLVATMGLAIILQNGMAVIFGPDPVSYPKFYDNNSISFFQFTLPTGQLINLATCILLLAFVSFYVRGTKIGRLTRAIAELPDVSAAFGVNVKRVCQITILIASIMAGIAAVSVGNLYGSASAFVGLYFGLKAFICMLVAGNRYFEGAAVVAVALGIIEALVTGYISSGLRDVVAFSILIIVLYIRPNGIFGSFGTKV